MNTPPIRWPAPLARGSRIGITAPPQFTLINGAWARVHFEGEGGWLEQRRLM